MIRTGKHRRYLTALLVITLATLVVGPARSADLLPPGKPLAQTWSIVAGQGIGQNWDVEQSPDGKIYVGGTSSLLEFDGAQWSSIATPDEGRVRDLQIDSSGRIWVASPGEFGYFSHDERGDLRYHSISQYLPADEQDFGETRFVRLLGDVVYFNTHQRVYQWANGKLTTFDKWDGLFRLAFVAHGRYYVAVKNRIYDLTDLPANGQIPTPQERWLWPDKARITFLHSWDEDQLLLGTYDDGLYLLSNDKAERFANDESLLAAWPYKPLLLDDGSLVEYPGDYSYYAEQKKRQGA